MRLKRFVVENTLVMNYMYFGSNCVIKFNKGDTVWVVLHSGKKISGVLKAIGTQNIIILEDDDTSVLIDLDTVIDMGAK